MPRIYVDFASLEQIGSRCKTVAAKVSGIQSDLQKTIRRLDWDVRFEANINSTANQITRKLEQYSSTLETYQRFVEDARNEYAKLDEISVNPVQASGESVEVFSTGKKIWKTVTSAGKATAAVVGCVATWAATVASGGGGAPLAILSTGYAANSVYSAYSDIRNLWLGDESKAGKVNWLKDTLVDNAGDLSEMLGGEREIGEFVGKCVYSAGDLIVNIGNAQNVASMINGETYTKVFENELKDTIISKSHAAIESRIIQNDTSFNTVVKAIEEIPTAVSGLTDIALNSPLGSIAYDYKLLSYQIKNLTEVAGAVNLLEEVADVTATVTKNFVEMVTAK